MLRPKHNEHVAQFRFCRIQSKADTFSFAFNGKHYTLDFAAPFFERSYGLLVRLDDGSAFDRVDAELLLWLQVYFGEDIVVPFPEIDTRFIYTRGTFSFDPSLFNKFIKRCQRFPGRSQTQWRRDLFKRALRYFSAALRGGFNLMPLNIGFFGMCLECIGNYYHGRRKEYFTLGTMRFLAVMRDRLKKFKIAEKSREAARRFERVVIQDVEIVHALRNAYYGHSLLHKPEDRKKLATMLRALFARQVRSRRFVQMSFPVARIDKAVTREGPCLYKVGLRTCRLFIFMLLGMVERIPMATHDMSIIGDLRVGEVLRFPRLPEWAAQPAVAAAPEADAARPPLGS